MSRIREIDLASVFAEAFRLVSSQYPLPCDGDSVYAKDVWVEESVVTGWVDLDSSGEEIALIPINNLHTRIQNSTADNPKILLIHFNRTVASHEIGIGCTGGGDFSNVLVKLIGSGGVVRTAVDESASATKYTSRAYPFQPELFNAIQLEFHTSDPVTVSNFTIQKSKDVSAQLRGLRADGVLGTVSVTNGNNLKVSLEELESGISTNSNSQLKVTQYDSSGNEISLDLVHNSQVVTQPEHHEIHEGNAYLCGDNASVNNGAFLDIVFTTGAIDTHLTINADVGGDATIDLFSGPTVTPATGTALTMFQRKFSSSNVSLNSALLNPTVTATGTQKIPRFFVPGGSGGFAVGGPSSDRQEYVLEQSTSYLIRLTNIAGTAQQNGLILDWYEV